MCRYFYCYESTHINVTDDEKNLFMYLVVMVLLGTVGHTEAVGYANRHFYIASLLSYSFIYLTRPQTIQIFLSLMISFK